MIIQQCLIKNNPKFTPIQTREEEKENTWIQSSWSLLNLFFLEKYYFPPTPSPVYKKYPPIFKNNDKKRLPILVDESNLILPSKVLLQKILLNDVKGTKKIIHDL